MDEKSRVTREEAVNIVRQFLTLDEHIPAEVHPVLNLHNADHDYYLVIFQLQQGSVGIGTVEMITGQVKNAAKLSGTATHTLLSSAEALSIAGSPDGAVIELVWQSSILSRSPLYPVWRITFGPEVLFVNQQGEMRTTLDDLAKG